VQVHADCYSPRPDWSGERFRRWFAIQIQTTAGGGGRESGCVEYEVAMTGKRALHRARVSSWKRRQPAGGGGGEPVAG